MELKRLEKRVFLATPTMHKEEQEFIKEAFDTNWVTTVGKNIDEVEKTIAKHAGVKYAVALSSGTSALHLATKLAAEKLYGRALPNKGTLYGKKVFASDMTFDASINPIAYEDGEAIFIDTEYDTWNTDPKALKKAIEMYPEVKLFIMVHLYGTPAKIDEIKKLCDKHGILIVEDACEALGAEYKVDGKWSQCGSFGDYNCISFNGNKIITGSSGGMFLTDSLDDANKVRKWSTQSRENAPWYQHEEIGYNYRMSNIIAGIIRGQYKHLNNHIKLKKQIYDRYKEGLKDLPIKMNPYDPKKSRPIFWLSCMIIDEKAMCKQVRDDHRALYIHEKGKTCPSEILETLEKCNIEGRPIWKPMHAQPIYRNNAFITANGDGRGQSNAYIDLGKVNDVGMDIFNRGLCLPSDIKMTKKEQDYVIKVIRSCFDK